VKSKTTERFRRQFATAPSAVQEKARIAYRLWEENPAHPSLRFKQVHAAQPIYSMRIDLDWRAVGVLHEGEITWFWIRPHSAYEQLLRQIHEPSKATWDCY